MCTKDTIRCTKTHDYTPIQSCCKEHLVELLKFVTAVLENNKIKYWLDYGTLLGAVREGGQIAWDDDCDISILLEDEEKVRTILTNNSYGYELYDNPLINEGSSFLGLRYSSINRCHIDIFAWYREGNLMKRRNYLDEGPISPDAKKGKHFPFSFIETLRDFSSRAKFFFNSRVFSM